MFLISQVECKQLVTRKHSLESELEDYKGEITQLRRKLEEGVDVSSQKMTALERVEFSLRNQLKVFYVLYTLSSACFRKDFFHFTRLGTYLRITFWLDNT